MSKRRSSKGTPAAQWFAGRSFGRHEQPTVRVPVLEFVAPAPVVDTQGSDPILPPSPPVEFSDEFLSAVEEVTR